MFIYLIVNHKTGKYYVGQHKGNNLRKYLQTKLSAARHQHNGSSHLFNAMRKYPQSSLWSIYALRSDIQNKTELDQTERDFIKFLRSQDPECGYNICRGGEGFTGPHSEEWKQNQSKMKMAWHRDPRNSETKRLSNIKISETKKLNSRPKINKVCPVCGKSFSVSFGRKEKIYCSHLCYSKQPKNEESEIKRLKSLRRAIQSPQCYTNRSNAQLLRRKREKEQGIKPVMPIRILMPKRIKRPYLLTPKHLEASKNLGKSNLGNHQRWHINRGISVLICQHCQI